MKQMSGCFGILALVIGCAIALTISTGAHAQTIVDVWDTVKAPPAPELKSVALDPKSTALLLLDFNKQTGVAK